ncbi:FimV family protein, partial [Halomonas sp. 707D7]|uniref:type IV pilus assembly protein FimV n=2 Tax=unclassified Halomonas TaxID=2609666 RepID=UPI00209E049B
MNKTLARVSWLSLTLLSPVALAAGLGQTTVLSPLSAPLDARIALLDVDDVPVEALGASVAEPSAFGALGLDWSPLLSGVDITPVRQNGRTYLQLTSGQPVDTPWLDVLVTLTTPAGRQTQAVTLLFDPVDYLPATPAAASVPRAPQPVRPAPVEAAPPRPAPAIPGGEIAVAPGDTLWNIALRTRAPGVEAQQMIAALVAANPQTFADGSIDNLRVGQRLRLPSREQALSLSPQEAARSLDARRAAPTTPPERTAEVSPAEEA